MKTEAWILLGRACVLLRETVRSHKDPADADYNGCDKDRCAWCQEAEAIMEEADED